MQKVYKTRHQEKTVSKLVCWNYNYKIRCVFGQSIHGNQNSYFRVIELCIIFYSKCSLMLYCCFNTNTVYMKRIIMSKAIRDYLETKQ